MWLTGLGATTESNIKRRRSHDTAATSHSRHDERDDVKSASDDGDWIHDERRTMDRYDDKLVKFGEVMNRIEYERRNMSTSELPFMAERRTPSSSFERRTPSSAYDFASRAMELKMSDDLAAMSGCEYLPHRDAGRGRGSEPPVIKSDASISGRLTPIRQRPSVLRDHEYGPMSAGNTPVRSSSPARSSSPQFPPPYIYQEGFKAQMKKYQSSLVTAHDTITALESDMDDLKEIVAEKANTITALESDMDDLKEVVTEKANTIVSLNNTIAALEGDVNNLKRRVNEKDDLIASLNVTITATRDEVGKLEVERDAIRVEKEDIHTKYMKGRQDFDERIAAAKEEKAELVNTVKDKESMIDNLRQEIQRLNEELEDGYIVRSQALKAEETANRMKEELDKSKEKWEECVRKLARKDEMIATLQAEFNMQLEKSNHINASLTDKVKNIEKRLEQAESTVLDSKTREMDLSRQLEEKQSELRHQRERFERYEKNCSREQDTVTALEKALEKLDIAYNERTAEIARLKTENHRLSTTMAEAAMYMEMYQKDLKESSKLNDTLEELQGINDDLGKRLHDKDDVIGKLESHLALLEKQSDSITSSKDHELQQLRQQLQKKDEEIEAFQDRIATLDKEIKSDSVSTETILKLTNDLSRELAEKEGLIVQLREFKELEVINANLRNEIQSNTSSKDHELQQLRQQLQKKDDEIEAFQDRIATLDKEIKSETASTEAMLKLTNDLSRELAEKEGLIAQLREFKEFEVINANLRNEIQMRDDELIKWKDINNTADQQLNEKNEEISKLKVRLASFAASSKAAIMELTCLVAEKEKKIIQLQGELHIKPKVPAHEIINLRKVEVLKESFEASEVDLKRYQEEAATAWNRVRELEESIINLRRDQQPFLRDEEINELRSELSSMKDKLAERDEQLGDSRKSIAEAQKMIFRLMKTVQELRRNPKHKKEVKYDHDFDSLIVAQTESSRGDQFDSN